MNISEAAKRKANEYYHSNVVPLFLFESSIFYYLCAEYPSVLRMYAIHVSFVSSTQFMLVRNRDHALYKLHIIIMPRVEIFISS